MNRAVYVEGTAEYYFQIPHQLLETQLSESIKKVYREKDSVINFLHAYYCQSTLLKLLKLNVKFAVLLADASYMSSCHTSGFTISH